MDVHPILADSSVIWVDASEGEMLRSDPARESVPKPHQPIPPRSPAPAVANSGPHLESLQHTHTAFAAADLSTELSSDLAELTTLPQPPEESLPTLPQQPTAPGKHTKTEQDPAPIVETRIDAPVPRTPVAKSTFRAAWEVDEFDIPATVAELFFQGEMFQAIAERMLDAVSDGLSTLLVTSNHAGEGRSSVAIGLAMATAATGVRVALVDADFNSPTLADQLNLELEHGWIQALRTGVPLEESAVHAVEDNLTLFPLLAAEPTSQGAAFAKLLQSLASRFDLIVVDGPIATSPNMYHAAGTVDSVVIVRDLARTDNASLHAMSKLVQQAGVDSIGVVENFSR